MKIPTMKVVVLTSGQEVIINESDFNESIHAVAGKKAAEQKVEQKETPYPKPPQSTAHKTKKRRE